MTPTTVNLRRARESLQRIKARIAAGTFSFADEFPDYQHLRKVVDSNEIRDCKKKEVAERVGFENSGRSGGQTILGNQKLTDFVRCASPLQSPRIPTFSSRFATSRKFRSRVFDA